MATKEAVRVDVWLWAARFFKTRSLAKQAIEGGKVAVNDATCKPAKTVRAGDRLRITRGEERLEVEVMGVTERRGPASEAQALYNDTPDSAARREQQRAERRLHGPSGPGQRPDKQARRALMRWKAVGCEEPE